MISVHQIIRDATENYVRGTSKVGKYVNYSMYETIETITAYLNSKHISGSVDSLGREKPFFNIVTASTNIWYRATDIDRKNIKIMPNKISSTVIAFIATVLLQEWMNKNRFGQFLNQWGRTLAKYGSCVVKFVEKDGELKPSVISWSRFIADPINFNAIPKIEKYYLTADELKRNELYDKNAVENLIKTNQTRKNLEGQEVDNQSHFFEIYEVHGELPTYLLDKDPKEPTDEKIEYRQQMHVVASIQNEKGDYDDYTLYKGIESKDPYMITHLIEEDDRTLSIGAVESLFDSQWMQNHSIKQWKDQLDLASKIVFQTSDNNFFGRNMLNSIENGDVMIYAQNQPLSILNNSGHDVSSIQSFVNQWKILSQEITSTPDALRGTTPTSGTPYSTTALLSQNANSLFELMVENKGLHLEDMLKKFVIPHIKKKLKNKDEIVSALEANGVSFIDPIYIKAQSTRLSNQLVKNKILAGQMLSSEEQTMIQQGVEQGLKDNLSSMGNVRGFKPSEADDKTWEEVFSDLEWENVVVEITNENKDKQATLQSLSSIFQTLARLNPQKADLILDRIMIETGVVSPIELSNVQKPTAPVGGSTVDTGKLPVIQ